MPETAQLFLKNLAGTTVGMVIVGAANLLLGATWPEVRDAIPGYIGTAVIVAVLITVYEVWKRRRTASS